MIIRTANIGLIGLAVMGEDLALNMEPKGFFVALYNRMIAKVDEFVSGRGAGKRFIGTHSPEAFVAALERPRKIFMLVEAGAAVASSDSRFWRHQEGV
jgi:6-phosphogluconate dehydrogenase